MMFSTKAVVMNKVKSVKRHQKQRVAVSYTKETAVDGNQKAVKVNHEHIARLFCSSFRSGTIQCDIELSL